MSEPRRGEFASFLEGRPQKAPQSLFNQEPRAALVSRAVRCSRFQ